MSKTYTATSPPRKTKKYVGQPHLFSADLAKMVGDFFPPRARAAGEDVCVWGGGDTTLLFTLYVTENCKALVGKKLPWGGRRRLEGANGNASHKRKKKRKRHVPCLKI